VSYLPENPEISSTGPCIPYDYGCTLLTVGVPYLLQVYLTVSHRQLPRIMSAMYDQLSSTNLLLQLRSEAVADPTIRVPYLQPPSITMDHVCNVKLNKSKMKSND